MAYMRIQVQLITVAVVFFKVINGTISVSCVAQTSCDSCTKGNTFIPVLHIQCTWCPLDRKCHTYGSNKERNKEEDNSPCYEVKDHLNMNITLNKACLTDETFSSPYDPEKAVLLAKLSAVAYAEPENLHNCLRTITSDDFTIQEAIGRKCEVLFSDYKECFAFTAISTTRKMIVLSFRGTAAGGRQLIDQLQQTLAGSETFKESGKVHKYFKYAFTKLYEPCILKSVRSLVETYNGFHVYVTGHSLGGAMASLAAYALVKDLRLSNKIVSLYTFGMPRVGDKTYAYNHAQVVPNSWRIIQRSDVVPRLPPTDRGFYHHRTTILYDNDMTDARRFIVCTDNEDSTCRRGFSLGDHTEYFKIDIGSFCEDLTQGREMRSPQFEENHCTVISLKDEIKIPNTQIITADGVFCDFETDFCGWTRSPGSTFNFQRISGPTDKYGKTGPAGDQHNSATGYFIFADGSNNEDHTARLRSPNFPAGQYCFEFNYFMWDDKKESQLTVDMFTAASARRPIFCRGSHDKKWNFVRRNIRADLRDKGQFHLVFEARMGKTFASDIALDDIRITKGLCFDTILDVMFPEYDYCLRKELKRGPP